MARKRDLARLAALAWSRASLGLGAVGDVAADALHLGRPVGLAPDQGFAPGDPARPERAPDLLVVHAGAVGLEGGVALLEHGQAEHLSGELGAGALRQHAEGLVGEGDAAGLVAQHDEVALGLEQAARPLLGFLELPVAVGQRLVVEREPGEPATHHPEPEAQRRQRHAGDREQRAGADGEGVRIIAGELGAAAGEESERAAERRREDHERPQHRDRPRKPPRQPAPPPPDA
jgi:hypothetical protein